MGTPHGYEEILMDSADQKPMFIREVELAARWDVSVKTLQRWRYQGIGCAHHKIGARVMYKLSDVEAAETISRRTQSDRTSGWAKLK